MMTLHEVMNLLTCHYNAYVSIHSSIYLVPLEQASPREYICNILEEEK